MDAWLAVLTLVTSAMALLVSTVTAWLTLFRRGHLKMTRPTTIYLGPDGEPHTNQLKIYMPSLLYSTSKKGQLVENVFARLSRGEVARNFYVWVHGQGRPLMRGSGLFVGQDGVVANHHFLLAPDETDFSFKSGTYQLEIFANVIGKAKANKLFETELVVGDSDELAMHRQNVGLYFDWGPDTRKYYSHIEKRPERMSPKELLAPSSGFDEFGAGKEQAK
ncbi:hypothetical protein [Rhizobium tumorigenes]|uniref:hypothetical protein n=1 Tax=Rhizobium tumorigenes TaxID=2041385 RepID=UPI00241C1957|nr:hypothetical protein [Rhizobium tumorigenes]WFS00915.1 hypothetical protein PR016_17790 [Rhizobium tumorigenes]